MKNTSRFVRLAAIVLAAISLLNPLMMGTASAAKWYGVGSYVTFGSYEQDNIASNGQEPIEWIVLYEDKDFLLLLSRYALDSERYHYKKASVSWETCSVRSWMNDTFYYNAFTYDERKSIAASYRPDCESSDYVFALSVEEAETLLPKNQDRLCKPTKYCSCQNVYVNPSTGGCWWLLSTTGNDGSKFAMSVNSDGRIDYDGGHVESDRGTVRPAIWVAK